MKVKYFIVEGMVFFYTEGKLYYSHTIISDKVLRNFPIKVSDMFLFYKDSVTDFKEIKIRGKNIDENFLKNLIKRRKL